MAVYVWLCVNLCVQSCGVFVTRHVCVGVTMRDLVDMEMGMWVNIGIWL